MSKKQTTWLVVAALIFVVTGVISVITNAISHKMEASSEGGGSSFSSLMEDFYGTGGVAAALSDMPVAQDFIAVVPVEGTIQATADSSVYGTSNAYNHDLMMEYIDHLIESNNNKGIILSMDTPGGTVYEADELYLKLKEYKEKTNRPVWAYMKSYCCSGGVYIASSADEQYANRNTTTGSIGVIISSYDMSALYEKLGIKEVNIVSAENKDMGSAGKPMTQEQIAIYQSVVDEAYNQFVDIVAEARNLSVAEVKKLADGRIYTAKQAEEHGLIDGIMGEEEFYDYVEKQSGISNFYEPKTTMQSYFSMLFGSVQSLKEKSESEVLIDWSKQLGSGVPMYYAKPIGR